jgi:hypothetical protein
MQQRKTCYNIYGWNSIKRYAYRMKNISQKAPQRMAALKFWGKHGLSGHTGCLQGMYPAPRIAGKIVSSL